MVVFAPMWMTLGHHFAPPAFTHVALTPPVCSDLRLEHVPVGHEHAPLRQSRHQVRRHQVASAVDAGVPELGVELGEAVADRDVRTDDQHRRRSSGRWLGR